MISEKMRSQLPLFATLTVVSAMVGCSSQNTNAVAEVSTVFQCQNQQGKWVTLAQRDNAVSKTPLFNWDTVEFGDNWTPEKRCDHVADKLTTTVAANGGRLGNLDLSYGKVSSGYTVICVLSSQQQTCNNDNMLFTLNEKNSQNPGQVLLKFGNFASGKSDGVTIDENGEAQYVSLETLVDQSLGRVW
jgi:hypothetical protein